MKRTDQDVDDGADVALADDDAVSLKDHRVHLFDNLVDLNAFEMLHEVIIEYCLLDVRFAAVINKRNK